MPMLATSPKTARTVDMMNGSGPTVVGFDQTTTGVEEVEQWVAVARQTLLEERVARGRLDLIFVDADEMAELNRVHMGHDGPTDVLAFPLDADQPESIGSVEVRSATDPRLDADAAGSMGDETVPVHLGDVVVCPSVAAAQASDHCGSIDAELSLLIIHGVLHVLGHDHGEPGERVVMQQRERHHLARYGHDHPIPA